MNHFSGKTALVTGAASGIGRALAMELYQQGATLYACDINEQGLKSLSQQVANPQRFITRMLDVTQREQYDQCILKIIGQHNSLDYIFNNAGIVSGGDFNKMSDDQLNKVIDINLWGVIHGTRAAYKVMCQQQSGHIINVASTAGVVPVPLSTAYTATKFAVIGLSAALREEARQHGVRVSAVIPGIVKTNIYETALNIEGHNYKASIDAVPIKGISADQAAKIIIAGVLKNKREIVFPLINRLLVSCYRLLPGLTGRLVNGGINR